MTLEQTGGELSPCDINRKGLANLLQALGQAPTSGIQAMIEGGYVVNRPQTTSEQIRQHRLGSNVIDLF